MSQRLSTMINFFCFDEHGVCCHSDHNVICLLALAEVFFSPPGLSCLASVMATHKALNVCYICYSSAVCGNIDCLRLSKYKSTRRWRNDTTVAGWGQCLMRLSIWIISSLKACSVPFSVHLSKAGSLCLPCPATQREHHSEWDGVKQSDTKSIHVEKGCETRGIQVLGDENFRGQLHLWDFESEFSQIHLEKL